QRSVDPRFRQGDPGIDGEQEPHRVPALAAGRPARAAAGYHAGPDDPGLGAQGGAARRHAADAGVLSGQGEDWAVSALSAPSSSLPFAFIQPRLSASPQMLIVVVKEPGLVAAILSAIGMKLSPWYSGVATYSVTLPSATSGAITLLSMPALTSAR